MTAKQYLEQYRDADREINKKLDKICRLREMATKTTTALGDDRVQSSAENKTEKIVAEIVDLDNEVNSDIDELQFIKDKVLKFIYELHGKKQRQVLCLRYIGLMKWNDIAKVCKCSRRKVIMVHDEAINILDFYISS